MNGRHREVLDEAEVYLKENSSTVPPVRIERTFNIEARNMHEALSETGWRRDGKGAFIRRPVKPNDFLESEDVKQMRPEDSEGLEEDLLWIADKYFDQPELNDEMRKDLHDLAPELVIPAYKNHFEKVNNYFEDVGRMILEPGFSLSELENNPSEIRDLSDLSRNDIEQADDYLQEMREQMTPDLVEYESDGEDIVRVVRNTSQRASRNMADMFGPTWFQIFDQEMYKAGWRYDGREMQALYKPTEEGFVHLFQYTI